jgi:hypothetical protein
MIFAPLLLASTLAIGQAVAGPPAPPSTVTLPGSVVQRGWRATPSANDSLLLAAADARGLLAVDAPFTRWLWVEEGPDVLRDVKLNSVGLNFLSNTEPPWQPPFVGGVKQTNGTYTTALVRVDFRRYASDPKDLKRWLDTWEQLAFDPSFSLLITADTINLLKEDERQRAGILEVKDGRFRVRRKGVRQPAVQRKRIVVSNENAKPVEDGHQDGERSNDGMVKRDGFWWKGDRRFSIVDAQGGGTKFVAVDEVRDGDADSPANDSDTEWVSVVRLPGRHLDLKVLAELGRVTHSVAPVVEWRYFLMRALATIKVPVGQVAKGDTLYEQVFGGLYYEFLGVQTAKQAGRKNISDLDLLFERLGLVDDAEKTSAQDKIDQQFAEQRVAMNKSRVTGKPRGVVILPLVRGGGRRSGKLFITLDVSDQSIDLNDFIFDNLLGFTGASSRGNRTVASEVFWETQTGAIGQALYKRSKVKDEDGQLIDEVPQDVASDDTIPAPYTKRLQCGSGCMICHARDNAKGWRDIPNEVDAKGAADIATDLSVNGRHHSREEIRALIASKYAGNADKTITAVRNETGAAVLSFAGPMDEEKDKLGTDIYASMAAKLEDVRRLYWYTPLNAAAVLSDLWIDPGTQDPLSVLRDVLRPEVSDAVVHRDPSGIAVVEIPEMGAVRQVLAGREIDRTRWAIRQGFVEGRVAAVVSARKQAQQKDTGK